jgi:UDP-N-acetylglucosamine--N-acetylmuramyl-(pentapeptide) pyrophosphoryl-undecaprenol N-acetylglucosamine transferase
MTEAGKLKRVLIMAGGTGGHVFPGLAVARALREQGVEVHWLGTSQGIEARLVPAENIPLHFLTISGLRGKHLKTLLKAPFNLARSILQARKIIQQVDPQVVLGLGGYASGPGGVASWLLNRPLVIHEQNAKAGYTNKILGKLAACILEGFPDAFKAQAKVQAVGNPVRNEIEKLLPPAERMKDRQKPFRLLVIGGSLGAMALNDIVPEALSRIPKEDRPTVIHQTGDKLFEKAKNSYQSMGIEAQLNPFIQDMAASYGWADMVICRAGALTVAELCAAGVGAVFIPYPHAVDDHQTANAGYMVKEGAALCIQQSQLTADKMADIIREFANAPEKRVAMAEAAYGLRKMNVQQKIVNILTEVVRGESH